jgi:hypothetical protein
VRRLPAARHRCRGGAARGVLAALPPALGEPAPPSQAPSADSRAGEEAQQRGGVASAPEAEAPFALPPLTEAADGLPPLLLYVAVGLVLLALAGMGASVLRALRE